MEFALGAGILAIGIIIGFTMAMAAVDKIKNQTINKDDNGTS